MIHTLFAQYRSASLQDLAERFYKEYYAIMTELCNNAANAVNKTGTKSAAALGHLLQYNKLVDEIKEYMQYRKDVLLPYMEELARKNKEGHDCSSCNGGCRVGHTGIVMDMAVSHARIHDTLDEIKTVSLQETDALSAHEWKALQNELALLESMLTEVYYLEQEVLLPKIKNAQRNIHAYGEG